MTRRFDHPRHYKLPSKNESPSAFQLGDFVFENRTPDYWVWRSRTPQREVQITIHRDYHRTKWASHLTLKEGGLITQDHSSSWELDEKTSAGVVQREALEWWSQYLTDTEHPGKPNPNPTKCVQYLEVTATLERLNELGWHGWAPASLQQDRDGKWFGLMVREIPADPDPTPTPQTT